MFYAIQGRPRDQSADWVFCTGVKDVPDIFIDEDDGEYELTDWKKCTPEWEYRLVQVNLTVVE